MRKEHAGACAIGGGPSNPIEAAGLHHARLFVPCFSLAAVPTADFESRAGSWDSRGLLAADAGGRRTRPLTIH